MNEFVRIDKRWEIMRNFIKANARVILGRKADEKSIGFYTLFNKKF